MLSNPDTLLTLSEASHRLPLLSGKRISPSTLWRWHRHGVSGVKLSCAYIGRRVFTSEAALNEFLAKLAQFPDALPVAVLPEEIAAISSCPCELHG